MHSITNNNIFLEYGNEMFIIWTIIWWRFIQLPLMANVFNSIIYLFFTQFSLQFFFYLFGSRFQLWELEIILSAACCRHFTSSSQPKFLLTVCVFLSFFSFLCFVLSLSLAHFFVVVWFFVWHICQNGDRWRVTFCMQTR